MESNNSMIISYPKKETEFEVQAKLYCKLKKQGFNVRGNVKIYGKCHLDLVVFDNDNTAKCIIEVKNWKLNSNIEKKLMKPSRKAQKEKYLKYNLPLIYCTHSAYIDKKIDEIKKNLLDDFVNIPNITPYDPEDIN